ncbi:MAG: acyl-CoA dehydrogenase, partial [Colwellia sp.]
MEQFTWFIYAVILTGLMAYTRAALSTFTLSFAALMAVGTIFDALSF